MKYLFFFILLVSCSKKEETKEKHFVKINYNLSYDYKDSLIQKIIPNKNYDYYAYIGIRGSDFNILNEKGDTLKKHKYQIKLKDSSLGFFQGCHPRWCADYIVTIDNNHLQFITSEIDAGTFLGTIDNLEEALLLAQLKGYYLDNDVRGNGYRITDKGYELHLMKFSSDPLQKESVEITIDKHGNTWTKSLGIYARGRDAYN